MWKSGTAARTTSLPGSSFRFQAFDWTTFATRLRCESIAAFGRPVVPPVYWRTATVVAGSDFTFGTVPGARTSVLQGRTAASVGKSVGIFCRRSTPLTNGRRCAG